MAKATKGTYDSSSIQKLDFPECVQKRPTMYIGDVGTDGVIHLIREVIDNSLDEFMNGYATKIHIVLNKDSNEIKVIDDGRGIPVDKNVLEEILCSLHTGGKFDAGSYATSSGLNGVGASCVNALSQYMNVTSIRDGYSWSQNFKLGKPAGKLIKGKPSKKTGTIFAFKPDKKFMMLDEVPVDEWINTDAVNEMVKRQAYLNKNLKMAIDIIHHSKQQTIEYCFANGILDYVKDSNKRPLAKDVFYIENFDKDTKISSEIALGYSKDSEDMTISFCNGIFTSEGGTHLQGFRMALSTILTNYIKDNKMLSKKDGDLAIDGKDCREGLVAIISVKHPNPLYKGQMKQKLSNGDVQGVIQKIMNTEFTEFLDKNPESAKIITQKIITAAKARKAAQAARNRIISNSDSSFASFNSISKLSDCVSKDNNITEVFIVEGKLLNCSL